MIPRGPKNAKLIIVGEAPGEQEELTGLPFMGQTGQDLALTCRQRCGIELSSVYLTNVFTSRPPGNKIESWLVKAKEARDGYTKVLPGLRADWPQYPWPDTYIWPPASTRGFLPAERIWELGRLFTELASHPANLIVAHGAYATWALCGTSAVTKLRGTITESTLLPGRKVLPTRHFAACYRDWSIYPTLVMDLIKAAREMEFPEIRRPKRTIYVEPTLEELYEFYETHLKTADMLSFDCEWPHSLISCVGLSPNPALALVVPFTHWQRPGYHYWTSLEDEIKAWNFTRMVLESDIPKLAQNGISDVQVLWHQARIRVRNFRHDTMLLHHSIYSESEKSLGFLGSIYTNEAAWKLMRLDHKGMEKRDE